MEKVLFLEGEPISSHTFTLHFVVVLAFNSK